MRHKVIISGIIGLDVIAKDIKKQFNKFSSADEIDIELNSPGGSVFEGIEISNTIKSHKGKTNLNITAFAASMGSHIAMSADHVTAFEDSTFMIHNASSVEWGDHRALRKTANVIESVTKILSKAYVDKTGKEASEIRTLMDNETWFFGDEILNSGFVDEIIKSELPEEKNDAVAFQKLVFIDSIEKMKSTEKAKADIDKLAAYFSENKPINNGGTLAASAATQKNLPKPNNKEETMTLTEFLAQNPGAKVEHNNLIEDAKKGLKTELKATSDRVLPIVKSGDYVERVTEAGFEAMSGERSLSSFLDFVALSDQIKEKGKSDSVQVDQPKPTPSDAVPMEESSAQAEMKAGAKETAQSIGV